MHKSLSGTALWIAMSQIPAGGFERGSGGIGGVVMVVVRGWATAEVLVVFGARILFMTHHEVI